MSAPTPAPGDDRPREGYYPDPSIPGYVRYWNGAAWVPGTSRPAPRDGEPLIAPPGGRPAAPAVEATGPHFFDEDPQPEPGWGADRAQQSGFGGDQDRRVSWGADPRVPADPPSQPDGASVRTDGTATIPPADSSDVPSDGTFVFRRPTASSDANPPFRAPSPRTGQQDGAPGAQGGGTPGFAAQGPVGVGDSGSSGASGSSSGSARPGFGAGKAAAARAAAAQAEASQAAEPVAQASTPAPSVPQQSGAATPMATGAGGGQSSWAQQVHRLAGAGDDQPVAPWKPPVDDPFQAAVRRQAAARPAGLGRRLAARLIDSLVVGTLTAAAAVPFGAKAIDHIQGKIDAAELSGRTVTVWLLDGTTGTYLGIVLAALLVSGLLYEVLPTAKWGRTLGKKVCGLEVRDIEAHEPPTFGLALRRWLVCTVPSLLVIGVVGLAWCLFDRPWRQCWHDKAAHTFVAS
ncbi:RDD family protein [Streptomyces herbicida]|uniref:RDD family protein n=1 Tax=Streptomyces herbicida TaxID=3065675 RepID=UPI002930ED6D|nr:RDD family protein [Streptomyces sp. NEAU-HV9]